MRCYECPNFDKVTYNPWAVEIAMNSRGVTASQVANYTEISTRRVKEILVGDKEMSHKEAELIGDYLNYPPKFFQQWFNERIEFGDNVCMPKSVPIKYENYAIMGAQKHTTKVISLIPGMSKQKQGVLF